MRFMIAFMFACLNRIWIDPRHGELQEDGHAPCTETYDPEGHPVTTHILSQSTLLDSQGIVCSGSERQEKRMG